MKLTCYQRQIFRSSFHLELDPAYILAYKPMSFSDRDAPKCWTHGNFAAPWSGLLSLHTSEDGSFAQGSRSRWRQRRRFTWVILFYFNQWCGSEPVFSDLDSTWPFSNRFGFGSEVIKFRNRIIFLITNQLIHLHGTLILLTNKIYFNKESVEH